MECVCGFLIESFGAPSWLDHKQKLMLLRQTETPDRHFGGNKLESKLIQCQSEMQTKRERKGMEVKERARKRTQCAAGCANSEHELSHKLVDEQFLMKVFW